MSHRRAPPPRHGYRVWSTPDTAMHRLGNGRCRARRPQPERPMRPRGVVVRGVPGKYSTQMSLPEDQHPVGEFGPHGQDEAFGEAVRAWTPRRDLDHLDARVRQDRVERGREPPGAVANEEPEPGGALAEIHHEVAGLLRGPRSVGMCRHAQHVEVAVADLEHEQHVEASQRERAVDVEEVHREHAGGLRAQELPPTGVDVPHGASGIRWRSRMRRIVEAPTRWPRSSNSSCSRL